MQTSVILTKEGMTATGMETALRETYGIYHGSCMPLNANLPQ
jgi:hypothetical protein